MSKRTPRKNIDDVESDRVVGFEKADVFLGTFIAGLEVGEPVLLRHLFGHVFPLEGEEHEPAQEKREAGAQADDY